MRQTYLIGKFYFISVHKINSDTFPRPINGYIKFAMAPVSRTNMIYTFRSVFVYRIHHGTFLTENSNPEQSLLTFWKRWSDFNKNQKTPLNELKKKLRRPCTVDEFFFTTGPRVLLTIIAFILVNLSDD